MNEPRDHFDRTICDCSCCRACCRAMPGMLAPGDFERIADDRGVPARERALFLLEHFEASPGALVIQHGQPRRVPTIVPAQREDGTCVFLGRDGLCNIHSVAPFGCSHFDTHMSASEGQRRSAAALAECMISAGYMMLWRALQLAGKIARPLVERRRRLEALLNSESNSSKEN